MILLLLLFKLFLLRYVIILVILWYLLKQLSIFIGVFSGLCSCIPTSELLGIYVEYHLLLSSGLVINWFCSGIDMQVKFPFNIAVMNWLTTGLWYSFVTVRCSHLANKYMRQYHSHSVEQDVEWLYAFDVHANAFFCSFLVTYVLQVRISYYSK